MLTCIFLVIYSSYSFIQTSYNSVIQYRFTYNDGTATNGLESYKHGDAILCTRSFAHACSSELSKNDGHCGYQEKGSVCPEALHRFTRRRDFSTSYELNSIGNMLICTGCGRLVRTTHPKNAVVYIVLQ